MADNTTLDAGAGGDVIATDDIGGVKYPRSKIIIGADGSNDGDVSAANPLPVKGTGAAGTANTGVVTVQGIAAMTPILATLTGTNTVATITNVVHVDDNSSTLSIDDGAGSLTVDGTVAVSGTVTVGSHAVTNAGTFAVQATIAAAATNIAKEEDAIHASSDTGVFVLAVRKDTAASTATTDGDYTALVTDSTGKLHVNVGNTVTVASHAVTNAGTFATQSVCTNAGTFAVQIDAAAVTSLGLLDDTIFADNASFTPGSSKVSVTGGVYQSSPGTLANNDAGAILLDANGRIQIATGGAEVLDDAAFTPGTTGVVMVGFEADEGSTDSVDEGDGGAARMTLDRKVIVTQQPHTAGGLSTFMASGSDGSTILVATAQVIKASAGQLYGYYLYNPEAAVMFVHFYNTAAASVTVGTTNPMFSLQIPPAAAANLMFPNGVTFSNAGWSIAATTTAGGNTAPTTGVSATIWYK